MPPSAAQVNPAIRPHIGDAEKIYFMFYFWGFGSAFSLYCGLSWLFPPKETMISETIYDDGHILEGGHAAGVDSDSGEEKNVVETDKRD